MPSQKDIVLMKPSGGLAYEVTFSDDYVRVVNSRGVFFIDD